MVLSPPSFVALTHDIPGTLVELAKLAGYLGFAYACLRLASFRKGRRWLATMAATVGTLVALLADIHTVVGAARLYGIYQPSFESALLSPILNQNHLAAFMTMNAGLVIRS